MFRREGARRLWAWQGPGAAFGAGFSNAKGLHTKATIGKGGVSGHQIKQRYFPSAKRYCRVSRKRSIKPGAPSGFRHFAMATRALHQPYG
jgi:hypothetical protein